MANEGRPNDCPDRREDGNDKVGMNLRWHGHALHAQTLVLAQQCNDSMERLEGMDDREARGVLKSLVQEYRAVNDSLAAFLARMSNANQGLVEMLQKSEEGRSSLMMRRAAEMLVKALANAEEEVQSLKAELKEVEGQRDNYKTLLAKTNSELGLAQAYAQMSRATGQAAARAIDADIRVGKASLKKSSSSAVESLVKRSRSRGSDKGKAPARRQGSSRENYVSSSPSDTVADVKILINAGIGNRAEDGAKSRQESISGLEKRPKRSVRTSPSRIIPGTNDSKALAVGTGAHGSGKIQSESAIAVAASSSSKRPRTRASRTRLEDDEYCLEVSPRQLQDREGITREKLGDGVDVIDLEEGVSDGEELSKGDVGSSSSAARDKRDCQDQSASDSDDAPSMFF